MPEENQALDIAKEFAGAAGTQTVNKIANAFGMLFPYAGLDKLAVDTYVDSVKASNLSPEEKFLAISGAKQHLKNLKNQHAIADIAQSAAAPGTDFSESSGVDDEWLARFMDAAKFVSDDDAQHIWGSILAGEFESPGSTPPSVIRILSELRSKYAKIFSNICSLEVTFFYADQSGSAVESAKNSLFVPDFNMPYLSSLDITYPAVMELELLGIINYESVGIVHRISSEHSPNVHVYYDGKHFTVTNYADQNFPAGKVRLTEAGKCIAKYVEKRPITDHLEAVKQYMKSHKCTIAEQSSVSITEEVVNGEVEYTISSIQTD